MNVIRTAASEALNSGVLHRPICDLLGCRYPLVLAGMGGVARSDLVGAVSNAGGFGLLGMVREQPQMIEDEVTKVRAFTKNFGVSIIPAATDPALLERQIATCIELHIPVVSLFWDLSPPLIERLRRAGILVICQVGSAAEAALAQQAGAQVLIAQGVEAGGHVRGDQPLFDLLSAVLDEVDIPVLAAGGIADGRDVSTVLSLGAQGAVLGTALLATRESFAHDFHKQAVVSAVEGEIVLTDAFHINWPSGAKVRVLGNSVTRGEQGDPFGATRTIGLDQDRPIYLFSTDSPLRTTTGHLEAMALYAGVGAARISDVPSAADRITSIAQAAAVSMFVEVNPPDELVEVSSPVCYAPELEQAYLDLASKEEVLVALNELLEAERAGARVAMELTRETQDNELRSIASAIWKEEVKWCGVLIRAIHVLNAAPSTRTGAFYGKAVSIADLRARLEFLNRGQAWVERKLLSLIPRIPGGRLQYELNEMLTSHAGNIAKLNSYLRPY